MRPASYSLASAKDCQCHLWVFVLALMLTLAISFPAGAQSIWGDISIQQGAQLWIEGSAGLVHYRCRAEKLSGKGEIENTENPQSNVRGHGEVHLAVSLPVHSLNCGKRAMNKDMYNALKAEQFPSIHYELLDARLAKHQPDSAKWMNIRTRGIMTIAGVKDTTTINVKGMVMGEDRFHVKGDKQLNMDTFDIDPPTAMFGLIRADKKLEVHFDVIVKLGEGRQVTDFKFPMN